MLRSRGIRLFFIPALVLFAFFVGGISALGEIATLTRSETQKAAERADLAANLVLTQIAASLRETPSEDPAPVLRHDSRLRSALQDFQQFTPSVVYLTVTDTAGVALCHSDSSRIGIRETQRETLPRPESGFHLLRQFLSILHRQDPWEISVPFLVNGRSFGEVRVGVSPLLLREEMRSIGAFHVLKLVMQVLLAAAFGIAVSWITILRPLARIEHGLHQIQKGNFEHRVSVEFQDELGDLARQVNTLSEVLSRERKALVEQRDTLASEGNTLRRLVDSMDEGVFLVDASRRVVTANLTACRILGADFSELVGREVASFFPPRHPLTLLLDRALRNGGHLESVPLEFPTPDGDRVYLTTCQVVGAGSDHQAAMVSLRDYRQMRQMQEMIDHGRMLVRLNRMAAGVAHEVRNPLNAMGIHLELFKEKSGLTSSPDGMNHLEVVQREIARLERVVYGFLKLARLRELSLKPIDVAPFLTDLRELMVAEARMAGVEIQVEVASGLARIYGDEELLRQAVLNLLRNAIQASPPGSPPITVRAFATEQYVRFVVEDRGEGIEPEVREKIFDLYYTTKTEGSGVGLALVEQAVDMHGGTIDVRSERGRGSTFTITLPPFSGG